MRRCCSKEPTDWAQVPVLARSSRMPSALLQMEQYFLRAVCAEAETGSSSRTDSSCVKNSRFMREAPGETAKKCATGI